MLVLGLCLWVSYECVGVTNVLVSELQVCLCFECACGLVGSVLVGELHVYRFSSTGFLRYTGGVVLYLVLTQEVDGKVITKVFEQSLGILLKCALTTVEALQTLDVTNMIEHIAMVLKHAIESYVCRLLHREVKPWCADERFLNDELPHAAYCHHWVLWWDAWCPWSGKILLLLPCSHGMDIDGS